MIEALVDRACDVLVAARRGHTHTDIVLAHVKVRGYVEIVAGRAVGCNAAGQTKE
jgi:hypothetical protein